MEITKHWQIVSRCEACLEEHGDNYLGVGWTKKKEFADVRYQVMLDSIRADRPDSADLLDFGCGASHLYQYMLDHGYDHVRYSGLDLSDKFLALSRAKYPHLRYYQQDILKGGSGLPEFDYVIANGIFNSRCDFSFDEMFAYLQRLVTRLFEHARVGMAFNVMSKQVEWEREDLFHLPFDVLADFLAREVSRHFVIRHDYGLYEYTVYLYRSPLGAPA